MRDKIRRLTGAIGASELLVLVVVVVLIIILLRQL